MKVSKEKSSFKLIIKAIKYLVVFALVFFLGKLAYQYISQPSRTDMQSDYYCNAEFVIGDKFITDGVEFGNGDTQSSEDAYTGSYSSKCVVGKVYAMTLSLPQVRALDTINISVAIKCVNAHARVVVTSQSNNYFKFKEVLSDNVGWEVVEYQVILPLGYKEGDTKVYTYFNEGAGHVFVDDLNVSIGPYDANRPVEKYDGASLRIKLTNDNYDKIKAKRKSALEQGLLFSSKDDLVNGDVQIDGKSFAAKLRLKGDLLDHLQGDKWSFRIQLKNGEEWNEMKNFSIHNSKARSHISEWVMHRLFRDEGIMTPAYDFINVELNEKPLGVYAYEQHFDNQLLKYNDRLIGPILKHNDDAYWENVQKYPNPFPWNDASYIELFNKENSKDQNFKDLFDKGQSMLNDFLEGRKTASEVFNLDKLSTYYALLDLTHSWHAQIFTNIRFYLDPVSGKLEPIGFDCFGSEDVDVAMGWDAVGEGANERYANKPKHQTENVYQFKFLKDPEFFRMYMEKTYHYTSPEFLKEKRKEYGKLINTRELFIATDEAYRDYTFSWDHVFKKAEFTRKKLGYKENMTLKACRSRKGKEVVDLLSFHPFPLVVIALGDKVGQYDTLDSPLLLEPYNEYIPVRSYEVTSDHQISTVLFRMLGDTVLYSTDVLKNELPIKDVEMVAADVKSLAELPFLTVMDKVISISAGRHEITQPLVIPADHTLIISAGAELIFKGGSLLSYGQVKAIGSERQKVIFKSDGRPGSGLLFSQSDERSQFSHCAFVGLNSYQNKNILTQGGVSVYKTLVTFDNCIFSDLKSREGLSIVFAETQLTQCIFIKSKGDAIRTRYSNIEFEDIAISECGGDGLNMYGGSLKGSTLNIDQTFTRAMRYADKVIANISNVNISRTETAITVSQNSKIDISNALISSAENGIIVKGKESKASSLTIENYKSDKVRNEYKVDNGSILNLNGTAKK